MFSFFLTLFFERNNYDQGKILRDIDGPDLNYLAFESKNSLFVMSLQMLLKLKKSTRSRWRTFWMAVSCPYLEKTRNFDIQVVPRPQQLKLY